MYIINMYERKSESVFVFVCVNGRGRIKKWSLLLALSNYPNGLSY